MLPAGRGSSSLRGWSVPAFISVACGRSPTRPSGPRATGRRTARFRQPGVAGRRPARAGLRPDRPPCRMRNAEPGVLAEECIQRVHEHFGNGLLGLTAPDEVSEQRNRADQSKNVPPAILRGFSTHGTFRSWVRKRRPRLDLHGSGSCEPAWRSTMSRTVDAEERNAQVPPAEHALANADGAGRARLRRQSYGSPLSSQSAPREERRPTSGGAVRRAALLVLENPHSCAENHDHPPPTYRTIGMGRAITAPVVSQRKQGMSQNVTLSRDSVLSARV